MKERLTGAIILVVLIVLLVPELLTGPIHPSATPAAASPVEPPLRSYTINLADDAHPRAITGNSGPAMPQPNATDASAGSQGTGDPARSAEGQESSNGAASDGKTADAAGNAAATNGASAKAAGEAASGGSAAKSGSNPAASGVVAKSGSDSTASGGTVARSARVAKPVATKASNAHAPAASSAHSEKPAGSGGWVVQLGVFASRQNAEHLALEVRVKGFKASVSEVTGSSRKLYRVRVGPAGDRAAAEELQTRLKAAGRPGGTVVPYSG